MGNVSRNDEVGEAACLWYSVTGRADPKHHVSPKPAPANTNS